MESASDLCGVCVRVCGAWCRAGTRPRRHVCCTRCATASVLDLATLDDTCTSVAHARTHARAQELIDKYGATVMLLNGLAASLMALRRFDEAEKALVDAIAKARDGAAHACARWCDDGACAGR